MKPVRVGLLGCGNVALRVHVPTLRRLSGVQVAAVADVDPANQDRVARLVPTAKRFHDYRDLLRNSATDAVVICLPPALHAEAARAALAAGKHVYLEKPLATTWREGRPVVEFWRATGLVGMIGFNFRFNPLYRSAREYLIRGALGPLVAARTVFAAPVRALPPWKERRDAGGGALLELGSHHLDLLPHLFEQEVVEVSAQVRSVRSQDDTAALAMRLGDGILVQSLFSIAAADEDRLEVYGQRGVLSLNRYLSLHVDVRGPTLRMATLRRGLRAAGALARAPGRLRCLVSADYEPSYAAALGMFVDAVRSGRPARPDLEDGLGSLRIVEAAEESARVGRVVRLRADDEDPVGA